MFYGKSNDVFISSRKELSDVGVRDLGTLSL